MPYTMSDRLPDPAYKRHFSGANEVSGEGDLGPGFASVKLTSDQKTMVSRTNSGRVLANAVAGHQIRINGINFIKLVLAVLGILGINSFLKISTNSSSVL